MIGKVSGRPKTEPEPRFTQRTTNAAGASIALTTGRNDGGLDSGTPLEKPRRTKLRKSASSPSKQSLPRTPTRES